MRISLRYHNGMYEIDLPARSGIKVVGRDYPPPLADLEAALGAALAAPVRALPLEKIIPPSGPISILISDLTRGSSAGRILPLLLRFFEERGAGPGRVGVILARGMHSSRSTGEIEAHLGRDVIERWNVSEHDATDRLSLRDVGTTPAGTRCLFSARVVESALVVTLGAVSFHYFAGYGGARKLILPGVSGEETILANHRLSLKRDPGEGLSGGCRSGNLDGNPVHEDMLAGARLLDARLFAVNTVADGAGNVVFLNAGDLDASHRAACDYLSAHFRVPVDRLYGAAIVSGGGFPKDINLLQSHKALRHASRALDEGGLMLAAAACSEGVGSDSYLRAFDGGRHGVAGNVRRRYTLNSQTAISTLELTKAFSIYLRSEMPESDVERFGFCPWRDGYASYLLEGIADEDILVVADGSQFLPEAR